MRLPSLPLLKRPSVRCYVSWREGIVIFDELTWAKSKLTTLACACGVFGEFIWRLSELTSDGQLTWGKSELITVDGRNPFAPPKKP